MNFDKPTLLLGICIGIVIGFILSDLILIYGFSAIANSFHVQSVAVSTNITIPLNESRMMDAINNSIAARQT